MTQNFKLIGGFGIAQKEIEQRKLKISDIIDRYYNVGIREFFIGYNPSYWHNDFGFEFSPNGRFGENEQITSYETFKSAIEYVHNLKDDKGNPCEIFLTVNFWYYSDVTMPLIKKIIDEAISANIDGFIVSNFETLYYLSEIGYKGKINVSTIMSIFNSDAVSFLMDEFQSLGLNLNRVVLPRELTLKEIKDICETFPDMEFEVFGQGDYCRYSNGLCLSEHKYFARDLCGFVIKHGLNFKKALRYDFKKIIFDESTDNSQKQELLNPSLKDLEDIFISQNVIATNGQNSLINKYINFLVNNADSTETAETAQKIYSMMKKDVALDYFKYIYDGLNDGQNIHNKFIDEFLTLHNLVSKYVQKDENLEQQIAGIKNIREKSINYYQNELKHKGKFGLETYYKFMIYNRTSVPFFRYFNEIKNIVVVKIPLRGRDLSVMKLGIDLIKDGIQNPEKYINEGNISGKYFHYDGSRFDFYKDKLDLYQK